MDGVLGAIILPTVYFVLRGALILIDLGTNSDSNILSALLEMFSNTAIIVGEIPLIFLDEKVPPGLLPANLALWGAVIGFLKSPTLRGY